MSSYTTGGISRRDVLAAGTAAGLALGLGLPKMAASAAPPMVRPDIASPAGAQMLTFYAQAVARMMDPAINNPPQPLSWTFQSFIHGVPKDSKNPANSPGLMNGTPELQQRIDQIYGNPAPGTPQAAWKAAAAACWGSCPHGSPNFVSWHRWYVYYFERVCAKMSGAANFALPYWNYGSNTGAAEQLPPQFRDTATKLFFQDRGLGFKASDGKGLRNVPMNKGGYMPYSESTYNDALQALPIFPSDVQYADPGTPAFEAFGFSGRVEVLPHDFVHDNVGGWMGNVPSAAGDPVFYVHHCQIDRLWASWSNEKGSTYNWGNTAASPSEATWTGQTFSFVDDTGSVVKVKAGETVTTANLGYTYDSFATPTAPSLVATAKTAAGGTALAMESGKVSISGNGGKVTLKPAAKAKTNAETAGAPSFLVMEDVRLLRRPNAPIHVFINQPDGKAPELGSAFHAGRLNLFRFDSGSGRPMGATGDHKDHGGQATDFRFNVRELLAKQKAAGQWKGGPLTVTFSTLGAGGDTKPHVSAAKIRLE